MKKNHLTAVGVLALVMAGAAGAFADRLLVRADEAVAEDVVTLQDVPAAVRAAALNAGDQRSISKIVREKDGEATTYEVEFNDNGAESTVKLSGAGEVIETERAIPAERLPAAAALAVKAIEPGAAISKVKLVTITYYEVDMVANGETHEVSVNAAGGEAVAEDADDEGDDKGGDDKDGR